MYSRERQYVTCDLYRIVRTTSVEGQTWEPKFLFNFQNKYKHLVKDISEKTQNTFAMVDKTENEHFKYIEKTFNNKVKKNPPPSK